ncbi:hypothetical protein INT45_003288 [Circinella minor]|uniref:Uncharacterized protein n=1 Tax=Circinella minor TaxID=1195481 RepID=A0A8H7VGR2_9FUNG|nr:hypothetical protein INT45_003288 [Circinella minor]
MRICGHVGIPRKNCGAKHGVRLGHSIQIIMLKVVELVEIDYRQDALQIKYSFKHMNLSAYKKQRKKEANKVALDVANSIITFEMVCYIVDHSRTMESVQHITTQNNQVSSPSLSLSLPSSSGTRLLDLQDATFQEYNRNAKLFLQNYKKLDCNQLEQVGAILKQSSSLFEKIINPQKGPGKQK